MFPPDTDQSSGLTLVTAKAIAANRRPIYPVAAVRILAWRRIRAGTVANYPSASHYQQRAPPVATRSLSNVRDSRLLGCPPWRASGRSGQLKASSDEKLTGSHDVSRCFGSYSRWRSVG
jgi:hypothetical protein